MIPQMTAFLPKEALQVMKPSGKRTNAEKLVELLYCNLLFDWGVASILPLLYVLLILCI